MLAVCSVGSRSKHWFAGFVGPKKRTKKGFPKVGSGVGSGWDPGPKSGIQVRKVGSTFKIPMPPSMKKRDPVEPTEGFIILKGVEGGPKVRHWEKA